MLFLVPGRRRRFGDSRIGSRKRRRNAQVLADCVGFDGLVLALKSAFLYTEGYGEL